MWSSRRRRPATVRTTAMHRLPPPASTGEGRPEAAGVDPPVVMLLAVDEGHRDFVAEAPLEVGVAGDGDLDVRLPELGTYLLDQRASVVAQVAVGTAVERDADGHSRSPSARR